MANQNQPDSVSSPGETIADILEDESLGLSKKQFAGLLNGELGKVLGPSKQFWQKLEANYRKQAQALYTWSIHSTNCRKLTRQC